MGNTSSSPTKTSSESGRTSGFSNLMETATGLCGSVNDTADESSIGDSNFGAAQEKKSLPTRIWEKADAMCISSPQNDNSDRKDRSGFLGTEEDEEDSILADRNTSAGGMMNPTSAMFARALVSEVTDNPNTMTPADMTEREKRLLKAQEAAKKTQKSSQQPNGPKPVGAPGGIGQPSILGSIAHAFGRDGSNSNEDDEDAGAPHTTKPSTILPPNSLRENRAQATSADYNNDSHTAKGKHAITIGLSLSRRHSTVGHPDTVTRQTAFDFNELQDRHYKYVSSTDSSGWLAGGGESGGPPRANSSSMLSQSHSDEQILDPAELLGKSSVMTNGGTASQQPHKVAAPDTVHIPIIHIDAESPAAVDAIIAAIARGEVFIPHMGVLPEALSVNGISPPDLVVRFGCERNDDIPPEEWPNWCLEFMHNQLYEYFQNMGARWMKRPFQITLARKVRWKTVKHMNRYFAHAERVIDAWREKGAQYLDPQLSYIEGGATPEEVARPHGIYLMRNGVPTNYFAPNFDPPYSTKMTRSLLTNVLGKSWDKKRREWTSEPVPRLVTPAMLMGAMCGCAEPSGGFMANEVTNAPNMSPPTQTYNDGAASHAAAPAAAAAAAAPDSPPAKKNVGFHAPQEGDLEFKEEEKKAEFLWRDDDEIRETVTPADSGDTGGASFPTSSAGGDPSVHASSVGARSEWTAKSEWTTTSAGARSEWTAKSEWTVDSGIMTSRREVSPRASSPPRAPSPHAPEPFTSPPAPERLTFNQSETTTTSSRRASSSSDMGMMSVANSSTTVPHINTSSVKIMAREIERNKSHEKLEQQETKKEGPTLQETDELLFKDDNFDDLEGNTSEDYPQRTSGPLSPNSTKKKNKKELDEFEKERARQIALIARAQEETQKPVNAGPGSKYLMSGTPRSPLEENLERNDSGLSGSSAESSSAEVSLDYSMDSSLLGQRFAGDGSVTTIRSASTALSSTAPPKKTGPKRNAQDGGDLSIQESNSASVEPIPTDEELFQIGWAKALDANSGSYYYFTLDRSKTVWENPLIPRSPSVASDAKMSEVSKYSI